MSRDVPRNKPLSDEDRAYLLVHGDEDILRSIDAQYPPGSDVESEEDGDDDAPYEEWTVADLQAEIDDRNKDRAAEQKMSRAGKKDELVARLRQDDADAE